MYRLSTLADRLLLADGAKVLGVSVGSPYPALALHAEEGRGGRNTLCEDDE